MTRFLKWGAALVVVGLLMAALAVWAASLWVDGDDFRLRVSREASLAAGVPVQVGRVAVALWPLPGVALEAVEVQTQPPLRLARLEAQPTLAALLQGRMVVATLAVRGAELPQRGIDALLLARQEQERTTGQTQGDKSEKAPENGPQDALFPRMVQLEGVTWTDLQGRSTTVDADARMAEDGVLVSARVDVRQGRLQGVRLVLTRTDAATPTWAVDMAVGGGSLKGDVQFVRSRGGRAPPYRVQGTLETQGVEASALTAPASGAQAPFSGKVDASSRLQTQGDTLGALLDALETQTRFTVQGAVVHGVDLARAVKTVGLSRGGETQLDALSGQVTSQGRSIRLHDLDARSGALAARGEVTLEPSNALSGKLLVDVAARKTGLLTVPLDVSGTLDAPSVNLSRGAALGAAIGTAILPGVGTSAGARLGDKLSDKLKDLLGR
jgi:uncharacterized protein involved in outer membrane biogenesis